MDRSQKEVPGVDQDDLQRMKEDVAAIARATGLEPGVEREDVWANLGIAGAGVVALLWALLPHGLPTQWGMVPLILLAVGYVVRMRVKYRRSTGRSPIRRREYTGDIVAVVVVGGLALIYRLWAGKLGISLTIAGSAALFLLGMSLVIPVLRDRRRLPDLGLAIPLMLCGLAIPLCSVSLWVPIGIAFAIGGLATAALTARQLRESLAAHAPD
ncbi:MAG: hypothetical protein ACYTFA_14510 [Planctomycetota bacterium]|jgi:hypothetical protein